MSIILAVLLILLICMMVVLIYRLGVFGKAITGWKNDNIDSVRNVNSWLFPLFFVLGIGLLIYFYRTIKPDLIGEAVTEHGKWIDSSMSLSFNLILVIFFVAQAVLVLFVVVFQYNSKRKASFYPINNRLEIVWTVIPLVVFLGLFVDGNYTWSKVMKKNDEDLVVVEIIGMQFNWIARYPGVDNQLGDVNVKYIDGANTAGLNLTDPKGLDDFVSGEIHIPVNKNILFKIRSLDVIHSVFIPHFRLKMDAVPGMPTTFTFKPEKTTNEMKAETGNSWFNYSIYCAELCGRGHFAMKGDVVVDTEIEYEKWLKSQGSWLARHKGYVKYVPDKYKDQAESIIQHTPPETTAEDATFFYKDANVKK